MAVMTLGVQNEPGIKITMTRPSTQEVLDKIAAGTLVAHPTRQPLQKKDVTTMMGTTATSTPARWSGGWNEEAQRRLETFLANPKRSAEQLALEDRKPEGKMPEDKKSSSVSSSSGSSSSGSDDSSDEAPKAACSPPRNCAMDLEVAKAKLKEKAAEVQTLKHDVEGIFSAWCHTSSELEKANIQSDHHKRLIDGLTKENAMLRRQLEGHGIEDVNDVDAPMASDDGDGSSSSSSEPEMTSDHGSADEPTACDN